MQKVLVSVYDKVANIYSAPMMEPNFDVALRNFRMGVLKNQMIMSNPADFELVVLGFFDDESGAIYPNIPMSLGDNGLDVHKRTLVSDLLCIRPDSSES